MEKFDFENFGSKKIRIFFDQKIFKKILGKVNEKSKISKFQNFRNFEIFKFQKIWKNRFFSIFFKSDFVKKI